MYIDVHTDVRGINHVDISVFKYLLFVGLFSRAMVS